MLQLTAIAVRLAGPASDVPSPALIRLFRAGATAPFLRLGITPTHPTPTWRARTPAADLAVRSITDLHAVVTSDDAIAWRLLATDRAGAEHEIPLTCRRVHAREGELPLTA